MDLHQESNNVNHNLFCLTWARLDIRLAIEMSLIYINVTLWVISFQKWTVHHKFIEGVPTFRWIHMFHFRGWKLYFVMIISGLIPAGITTKGIWLLFLFFWLLPYFALRNSTTVLSFISFIFFIIIVIIIIIKHLILHC